MKIARVIACLVVTLMAIGTFRIAAVAGATPEKLDVAPTYPTMQVIAGSSVSFEVQVKYTADNAKVFDLQVTTPSGWEVYVTPQGSTTTKISSIRLDPAALGAYVNVVANAPIFPVPAPGSYKITLTVSSSTLKASADLTAIVTPIYVMNLTSAVDQPDGGTTGLTAIARPGEGALVPMKVQNLGTADINGITFASTRPADWTVTFDPPTIDSLAPFREVNVDVNIKPGASAIPGDYVVSLNATATQVWADKVDVRVTVVGPNTWAWVQISAVLLVVAGLVYLFLKSTRR